MLVYHVKYVNRLRITSPSNHRTLCFTWFRKKDGKTLVSGSKHGIEWDAVTGTATLKFKSLTEADSGSYECYASSSAGSVSCSTTVNVKSRSF